MSFLIKFGKISLKSCYKYNFFQSKSLSTSFITTPIFYVNSYPHIGHLYTLLLADASHRSQNFFKNSDSSNKNFIFSTGTDEHGQKIEKAAINAGVGTKDHVDKVANSFKLLCKDFNVSNTDFVRTTEERHKKSLYKFWSALEKSGNIYKGSYEGWYNISDEAFLPQSHPVIHKKSSDGKVVHISEETGHIVEWVSEDNYKFKLGNFTQDILKWIKTDNPIQPQIFSRPVIKWLEEEVADLSISRPKSRLNWGIPVPFDTSQVIYVWLDALVNYLTVSQYGEGEGNNFHWPPTCQLVGKDILKFHAIYWPAFLLSAGLELPRKILCHSHWTIDNVKMSKSLNNVVSPYDLKTRYGEDGVRYFLLSEGVPHSDGNFNEEKLVRLLNSELSDTLGNLLSRSTSKILNPKQIWPSFSVNSLKKLTSPQGAVLKNSLQELPIKVKESYENFNFYRGIEHIMTTLRLANCFMEEEKPWNLVKINLEHEELRVMTSLVLETLRICGILLLPIIPKLSNDLLKRLNIEESQMNFHSIYPFIWEKNETIDVDLKTSDNLPVLFPRIQRDRVRLTSKSNILSRDSIRNLSETKKVLNNRKFHTSCWLSHGEYEWKDAECEEDVVVVTVINKDGKSVDVRGKIGDNLLYLCKRFGVEMEGACEASLACTTCHVYINEEFLHLIPEATETEEDLLDQAPFLKNNSRLGCQIILKSEYRGMMFQLPAATKNFYVDGHKPTAH